MSLGGAAWTRYRTFDQMEKLEVIEALLDSHAYGYAIVDAEANIIEWNPALERMTGWSEKEIQEAGLGAIIPAGELWVKHKEAFNKAMDESTVTKPKISVVQCVLPAKGDKKEIPVRVSVRVVKTYSGKKYAITHIDKESLIKRVIPDEHPQTQPEPSPTQNQTHIEALQSEYYFDSLDPT